jgi:hypothetical protein
MAASVIDAQHATLIGTPEQLLKLLELLSGGASIVDLTFASIVVLNAPVSSNDLRTAISTMPDAAKGATA